MYAAVMDFAGAFPPLATPFNGGGQIDPAGIRSNVTRLIERGVRGIVALGSNGEAPLLDEEEADVVIDAVRAAVPRDRLLIAGTGRESTRGTIDASRRAQALGADAVLVRTPSYFKPRMTPDVLVHHYTHVADALEIPVLLYNYPAVTGITFTPDTVGRLAQHPNIVGIKETSTDAGQIAAYVDASRGQDFAVLAGSAPAFYPALALGAVGGILAVCCVVPRACVALFEAFRRGDHAAARDLQRRIVPLAQAVTSGHGVPGLKAAMELAGYVGGPPRHPLLPVSADVRAAIGAHVDPLREFL
jgi:4-hydroxy-2-oxoglutarate aldolase